MKKISFVQKHFDSQQECITDEQIRSFQIKKSLKRTQLYLPLKVAASFNVFKQMSFFQKWITVYSGYFLRQILPYFCWTVYQKELDHQQFIYFRIFKEPNLRLELLQQQFHPVQRLSFLKINKQVVQILQFALNGLQFQKEIFKTLSIQQKFWMLCECKRITLPFNRFFIKKGTLITNFYITINGEFTQCDSKGAELRHFNECKIFGLQQIQDQCYQWNTNIKTHNNQCIIFQMSSQKIYKYLGIKLPNQKVKNNLQLPLTKLKDKSSIKFSYSLASIKNCQNFKINFKNQQKFNQKYKKKFNEEIKKFSEKCISYQERYGKNQAIRQSFQEKLLQCNLKRYSLVRDFDKNRQNSIERLKFFQNTVQKIKKNRRSLQMTFKEKQHRRSSTLKQKNIIVGQSTLRKSNKAQKLQIINKYIDSNLIKKSLKQNLKPKNGIDSILIKFCYGKKSNINNKHKILKKVYK